MSFANTILYTRTIPPLDFEDKDGEDATYSGDDIHTLHILKELENYE